MNSLLYGTLKRSLSLLSAPQMHQGLSRFSTQFELKIMPCFSSRTLSTSPPGEAAQKKTKVSPKITLVAQNQTVTVTTLEEARKLAKRRDLHLVQTQQMDAKTQRAEYKLVTTAEMLSEDAPVVDKEKSAQKKSEKLLTIGARISDHDLSSRMKNISKWLAKRHEVRVLIQGNADDMSNCEKIVKTIERSIKEPEVIGKIVQKRTKGASIRFAIIAVEQTALPDFESATNSESSSAPA